MLGMRCVRDDPLDYDERLGAFETRATDLGNCRPAPFFFSPRVPENEVRFLRGEIRLP